jgi:hypothetical protein
MKRQLTITNMPSGKKYVPGFRIAGKYLAQFNFKCKDVLNVNFFEDVILISKNKDDLKRMIDKNPALQRFIDKFDLVI